MTTTTSVLHAEAANDAITQGQLDQAALETETASFEGTRFKRSGCQCLCRENQSYQQDETLPESHATALQRDA